MKNKSVTILILVSLLVLISIINNHSLVAKKQQIPDNSECLMCHDDPDITMERKGKEISLTVRETTLPRSVHAYLKCTQCHVGFSSDDFPHKKKITPVKCINCHKDVTSKHKFHPQLAKVQDFNTPDVNCKNCHGTHSILSPKNSKSKLNVVNIIEFCGKCHVKEKKQYLSSVHSKMFSKNNTNAPVCIDCHSQPIVSNKDIDLATLKLNQDKMCMSCHTKSKKNKNSKALINYQESIHSPILFKDNSKAATCIDCHGSHNIKSTTDTASLINKFKIQQVCAKCHIAISNEYSLSIHGIALKKGNQDVPDCSYCHGLHLKNRQFQISNKIIVDNGLNLDRLASTKMITCVKCHTNKTLMKKYNLSTIKEAHNWLPNRAAHWNAIRCVDCHSSYEPPNLSHNLLPQSKVVKNCESCHSKNSILMTKLYKYKKEQSIEKLGFVNGTLLSDAYVIGANRNKLLDAIFYILFGIVLLGILFHTLLRWYFKELIKKPMDSYMTTQNEAGKDVDLDKGGPK